MNPIVQKYQQVAQKAKQYVGTSGVDYSELVGRFSHTAQAIDYVLQFAPELLMNLGRCLKKVTVFLVKI